MGAAGDTIEVETRYGRMWALRGDRITACLAAHGAYCEAEGAFTGEIEDVTGGTVSLNMLCLPKEPAMTVIDLERIDPANWRSPVRPLGAK
jgi:hypothetical protein